jgi:hypothetical protein
LRGDASSSFWLTRRPRDGGRPWRTRSSSRRMASRPPADCGRCVAPPRIVMRRTRGCGDASPSGMWRWVAPRMWRCVAPRMWRCVALGMRRCVALGMRRCVALGIWRCVALGMRRCVALGIWRCVALGMWRCVALGMWRWVALGMWRWVAPAEWRCVAPRRCGDTSTGPANPHGESRLPRGSRRVPDAPQRAPPQPPPRRRRGRTRDSPSSIGVLGRRLRPAAPPQ